MSNTDEFDLEKFADLFDTALSSDNPAVKRALKNLLIVASLIDDDVSTKDRVPGPFRKILESINSLNARISNLELHRGYPSSQISSMYKDTINWSEVDFDIDELLKLKTKQENQYDPLRK